MYKLVQLLKRILVPLLFIVMEVFAIIYYANSTSYTQAKLLTASNSVIGEINSVLRSTGDYFRLNTTNEALLAQIEELQNSLANYEKGDSSIVLLPKDTINPYTFTSAQVIKNSVFKQNNLFILNKGLRDGIEPNMSILTIDGVAVGYVLDCSDKFSVCMSIANRSFKMGGKIGAMDHLGSISWDGEDYRKVKLYDIPHYADLSVGDQVVSTISSRFPPDMPIGKVEHFEIIHDKATYDITIKLDTDLSLLRNVIVVKYQDESELTEILNEFDIEL